MRRSRVALVVAALVAVGCGSGDEVSNVSSEDIPADSTPPTRATDPTNPAPPTTDPTNPAPPTTGPVPPTSGGSDTVPTPGTASPSPPPPSTPDTVDVAVPDDCVNLPGEAPAIIVADSNGVVYQVGVGGTQIIADSEDLPATVDAAWRAKGGALWVGLHAASDRPASVGRLDAGKFVEIASGNVNVQHVGTVDDVPVALWFDYGSTLGSGSARGRVVIEDADGNQTEVAAGRDGDFRIATGGIGGNAVALTEESLDAERFRYLDIDGQPVTDWYNPVQNEASGEPPSYRLATPSPDGSMMSWAEGPEYDIDTGELRGDWQLVVASTEDGTETFRQQVAQPEDYVTTGDFDGRWFLMSFTSGTVLVDTTKVGDQAVTVPCIPLGSATLDRAGGGGGDPPPTTTTSTTTPETEPPSPPGTPGPTGPGGGGVDP